MRSVNFSQENLAVQWQYVKRNLRELGVIANFDDFERKAHKAIEDLMVDGLWISVKDGDRLRNAVILFVLGITLDNKKDIVAFKLAKGETEEEVTGLLNDLSRRGLEGKHLKLVASDGSKGIRAAINMVYPYARWQLCHTHKLKEPGV